MPHYFYLARCCDGSIYAGTCIDLKKREALHNRGDGAKYTRSKLPVKMVYSEKFETLVEARRREAHVKGWTKEKKERLIHGAVFGHYEKWWYHPISMEKAKVQKNPHVEKIYFAGSIRGGREGKELYLEIITLLGKYGKVLTEHVGDKTLSALGEDGRTDEYIYQRDMAWLQEADVVVAEVTTPSLGVEYEIGKAEGKRRVLCLFREQDEKRLSAMISGNTQIRVEKYRTIHDVERILKVFFEKR